MTGTDVEIERLRQLIEAYASIKQSYNDSMNAKYYNAKEDLEKYLKEIKVVDDFIV